MARASRHHTISVDSDVSTCGSLFFQDTVDSNTSVDCSLRYSLACLELARVSLSSDEKTIDYKGTVSSYAPAVCGMATAGCTDTLEYKSMMANADDILASKTIDLPACFVHGGYDCARSN